jgi:uncharacterized protein YbcI
MNERRRPSHHTPLQELSNAMVALHRDLFGRGPAEAKSAISAGMAVCMLRDIYTPLERRLIEGGRGDEVLQLRFANQRLCEEEIKQVAADVLGRPIQAALSSFHVNPDLAIEFFLLGPAG